MLGDKFSIIGVGSEFNYGYIKQVRDAGLESRLVSIKSSNLTVMDVNTNYEESKRIILKLCREAVEKDGADSLLLGCMSMAFMDISEELSSELDIPVVNAAKVSLYNLYSLIKSKLFFSPKTYGAVKGFPRRR
jgi:allantoin racemase